MTDSRSPIELLEWDTTFFGFRVARVRGETLTPERARQISEECIREGVRCVYFLCGLDDPASTQAADLRTWQDSPPSSDIRVREARPADLPALEKIAGEIHQSTRFFYDRMFPERLSAELYRTWIRVSLDGYASRTLVGEMNDAVAGYITCSLRDNGALGQIGLVGVGSDHQGSGIGQVLVTSALGWFSAQHAEQVTVVTQGRNYAAQRLYQRLGFLTQSVKLWYHKWYGAGASDE
jgi:dTDP-4-amino-4,6-dideoxy-D-galactose acyltransferase